MLIGDQCLFNKKYYQTLLKWLEKKPSFQEKRAVTITLHEEGYDTTITRL